MNTDAITVDCLARNADIALANLYEIYKRSLMKQYFSITEASTYTGYSTYTIRRAIQRKTDDKKGFPPLKAGKDPNQKIIISRTDLEAWMRETLTRGEQK
ncbi:helix-turn-helix domain-containing protein [Actinotignum urinale]|uniref:Helix-turn-helix domain-containing protein n=1 Tax=Actinotignum urinale TaxID=190146 RepID=A0ABU5G6I9_9ACTO|nr:helix-turn-helix domain-containing protein [Actinotignum urinale]MDY5132265.1 helix-turn-helix domain-containing protein [Actinotignum urinale]